MRLKLPTLVLSLLLVAQHPAFGDTEGSENSEDRHRVGRASRTSVDELRNGAGIGHEVVVDGGSEGSAQKRRGRRVTVRVSTPRPPVHYAHVPELIYREDGGLCLAFEHRPYPDRETAALVEQGYEQQLMRMIGRYPMCTNTARPRANPAVAAADYWRVVGEDLLPRPRPAIAPGFMITGKRAYLEANAPLSDRFSHPTPLGLLTIEATGLIYVDWGDGTAREGPYNTAGGPWPDGTITHVFTRAGRYDVVVTERWHATWQLGERRGELVDLATEGRIEDFEVRQLQAVRRR
jgi:hypothetical protein